MLDWQSDDADKYIGREDGIFSVGQTAQVIDVETNKTLTAYRRGGKNHVDWEPATEADTETLKSLYGEYSWDRRAVVVNIGGELFAASINGMPHGKESIKDNGVSGHLCMHFLNSKTHGSQRIDPAHQDAVAIAFGADVSKILSGGRNENRLEERDPRSEGSPEKDQREDVQEHPTGRQD